MVDRQERSRLLKGGSRFAIALVFCTDMKHGGGSVDYIDNMFRVLSSAGVTTVKVNSKALFDTYSRVLTSDDIILFNHLFYTGITIPDVIRTVRSTGASLYVAVHDAYLQASEPRLLYESVTEAVHGTPATGRGLLPEVYELLSCAVLITANSEYTAGRFADYPELKVRVMPMIDLAPNPDYIDIPPVGSVINIGIINTITVTKGRDIYSRIFPVTSHAGYEVRFHVYGLLPCNAPNTTYHGIYDQNGIFPLLKQHGIHGLLFFNKYPETYSFAATKGINSGLPVMYTAIGAYPERFPSRPRFMPVAPGTEIERFREFLDLILSMQGKKQGSFTCDTEVPAGVYSMFLRDADPLIYAVYFPQFTPIPENDVSFYPGYHDMRNLQDLCKEVPDTDIPLRGLYSLTDRSVIPEQIDEAVSYGISGFGIYWYWFGVNTIGNRRELMKDVTDQFLAVSRPDFNFFFIWANEDWSGNPAFNNGDASPHLIQNEGTRTEMTECCAALIEYFRHPSYTKIEGAPVFMIHHPAVMESKPLNIAGFTALLREAALRAGFPGVSIYINRAGGRRDSSLPSDSVLNACRIGRYDSLPVYTAPVMSYDDQIALSDSLPGDAVKCLFCGYDMAARFFHHRSRHSLIRKVEGVTPEKLKALLFKQLSCYRKRKGPDRIYLLNAWNEWGEAMAFEPSLKYKDTFLSIINKITGEHR